MKITRKKKAMLGIAGVCAAAIAGTSCLFAFSEPILPPVHARILFPLEDEDVVLFDTWVENDVDSKSRGITRHNVGEGDEEKGAEIDRKLEEAGYSMGPGTYVNFYGDDFVTVNNPTADQIILRKDYSVVENGEIKHYAAVVFGDGSGLCVEVQDEQEEIRRQDLDLILD